MGDTKQLEQEVKALKEEVDKLKKENAFLTCALENLPNPIFMKDEDAKFILFNKPYSEFFGMEKERYIGKTVLSLEYLPMESRERYQEEDLGLINSSSVLSYEVDFEAADGHIHPSFYWSKGIYEPIYDQKGLIGEIVDISKERSLQESLNVSLAQLKETNEKLEHIAEIDAGTGVYNRLLLNKIVEEGARNKFLIPSCMLLLDVDHLKEVNDTFGHLTGDDVLKKFADILKTECREDDLPIRYGGDEFLLIINNATLDDGASVAERIRSRCENEIKLPNGTPLTTSIGVAKIEENTDDIEKMINKLDENLYEAKEAGHNKVVAK